MLYLFGFDKVGVVVADLFFVDPDPIPGQESPERGVRLEVRLLEPGAVDGTIYAARPILINRPIWRADLLESVDGPPGSFDRTHHHPHFVGWEPGTRAFVEELSQDPFGWVGKALENLEALVLAAELPMAAIGEDDPRLLSEAVPEIVDSMKTIMNRIHAGELGLAPVDGDLTSVRSSWL
jgi:hypothetical protein